MNTVTKTSHKDCGVAGSQTLLYILFRDAMPYSLGLSAVLFQPMNSIFLTTNQLTTFSAMTFQPSEQGVFYIGSKKSPIFIYFVRQ
jgi:hypothetical protein